MPGHLSCTAPAPADAAVAVCRSRHAPTAAVAHHCLSNRNTISVLSLYRHILPRENKNPDSKNMLSGTKSQTLRCHPALTRHRCRIHSSTANTARLLTRALRPRLLVAFRLGPPGPILSGSVPAGITPPPTLSQSVSRFLPVNGFSICHYIITAFFACQRIFRPITFFYCLRQDFRHTRRIFARFLPPPAASAPSAHFARAYHLRPRNNIVRPRPTSNAPKHFTKVNFSF